MPFHPDVLHSRRPKSGQVVRSDAAPGTLEPNSGKWRQYFSASAIQRLEGIAGDCLAQFGYEVEYEAGDRDPHPIIVRYWTWGDWGRQLFRGIVKTLRNPKKRNRWLFRNARAALRQSRMNRY